MHGSTVCTTLYKPKRQCKADQQMYTPRAARREMYRTVSFEDGKTDFKGGRPRIGGYQRKRTKLEARAGL